MNYVISDSEFIGRRLHGGGQRGGGARCCQGRQHWQRTLAEKRKGPNVCQKPSQYSEHDELKNEETRHQDQKIESQKLKHRVSEPCDCTKDQRGDTNWSKPHNGSDHPLKCLVDT